MTQEFNSISCITNLIEIGQQEAGEKLKQSYWTAESFTAVFPE